MIVIEGTDGIGKTTLAKTLVELLNDQGFPVMYSHMGRPPGSCFDYVWGYKYMMSRNVVMDRFHLGEIVYRQVTEGITYQTPMQFSIVQSLLNLTGAVIVICHADKDIVTKNVLDHPGRELFSLQEILKVNELFEFIVKEQRLSIPTGVVSVNYDLSIRVQRGVWPSSYADTIIELWKIRQEELDNILRREPFEWTV